MSPLRPNLTHLTASTLPGVTLVPEHGSLASSKHRFAQERGLFGFTAPLEWASQPLCKLSPRDSRLRSSVDPFFSQDPKTVMIPRKCSRPSRIALPLPIQCIVDTSKRTWPLIRISSRRHWRSNLSGSSLSPFLTNGLIPSPPVWYC